MRNFRPTRHSRSSVGALVAISFVMVMAASGMRPAAAGGNDRTPGTTLGSGRAADPTVTVTETNLVDFQPVRVTGSGFEPYTLMEWFQCRGGAVSEADCDGFNADFVDSDSAGNVDVLVYVDARIFLPDGTEVDCRTDPAGCEVGIGYMLDADEWPEAQLHFDPEAPLLPPVSATVAPASEITDGTALAVSGEHLSFREYAYAFLCSDVAGEVGTRCDIDHEVHAQPRADGTITLELPVTGAFRPPLGGSVDCRAAGTSCGVLVSWGFSTQPDRSTFVPVTFADVTTSTTTTTTTAPTTSSTTPNQVAPPATPAAPVAAQAGYTG